MGKSMTYWHEAAGSFHVPYYPNVTMGWDPTPRLDASVPQHGRGYPDTPTISGNTPEAFRKALVEAASTWTPVRPTSES